MGKMSIDKKLIEELAEVLNKTGLTEIEYEESDRKIRVAKQSTISHQVSSPAPIAHSVASEAITNQAPAQEASLENEANFLKSPMVGTAYLASSPDTPPFASVGDTVSKGQTVMIIEAMKVMNPIKAHKDGVVKKICVENGQPVEFEEPLLVIA